MLTTHAEQPPVPYTRISGKDAVAVEIPAREMQQASRLEHDAKTILAWTSACSCLALAVTAALLFKLGVDASTIIGSVFAFTLIGFALGSSFFIYNRVVSRKALGTINTRMTLATQETFGVSLKPLTGINPNVREHFTMGVDRHDATTSIWKLTIGDDWVRCWRISNGE